MPTPQYPARMVAVVGQAAWAHLSDNLFGMQSMAVQLIPASMHPAITLGRYQHFRLMASDQLPFGEIKLPAVQPGSDHAGQGEPGAGGDA
jgi:hypothetical protein